MEIVETHNNHLTRVSINKTMTNDDMMSETTRSSIIIETTQLSQMFHNQDISSIVPQILSSESTQSQGSRCKHSAKKGYCGKKENVE